MPGVRSHRRRPPPVCAGGVLSSAITTSEHRPADGQLRPAACLDSRSPFSSDSASSSARMDAAFLDRVLAARARRSTTRASVMCRSRVARSGRVRAGAVMSGLRCGASPPCFGALGTRGTTGCAPSTPAGVVEPPANGHVETVRSPRPPRHTARAQSGVSEHARRARSERSLGIVPSTLDLRADHGAPPARRGSPGRYEIPVRRVSPRRKRGGHVARARAGERSPARVEHHAAPRRSARRGDPTAVSRSDRLEASSWPSRGRTAK
jgi:hypothetical protein